MNLNFTVSLINRDLQIKLQVRDWVRVRLFNSSFQASHNHNIYPFHPMSYSLCLKPTWRTRALETSLITRRQRRKQQINISQPVYKGYHGFCAPCVVTPVLFVCCLFIVWKWPGTTSVFHRYEISFDVTALLNIIIWRHIFFTHKESKTPRAAWLRREGVTTRDFSQLDNPWYIFHGDVPPFGKCTAENV